MQGMFVSLISWNIFCAITFTSCRKSKRSRPDLINVWLYDRAGYSNILQRFWARSMSWENFWWDQDARLHMHIQEQNGWLNNTHIKCHMLEHLIELSNWYNTCESHDKSELIIKRQEV